MAEVAALYGLSVREAMNLSEKETTYMLEAAKATMYNLALTSPDMQNLLKSRLGGVARGVREVRALRDDGADSGGDGDSSASTRAIGAPPV